MKEAGKIAAGGSTNRDDRLVERVGEGVCSPPDTRIRRAVKFIKKRYWTGGCGASHPSEQARPSHSPYKSRWPTPDIKSASRKKVFCHRVCFKPVMKRRFLLRPSSPSSGPVPLPGIGARTGPCRNRGNRLRLHDASRRTFPPSPAGLIAERSMPLGPPGTAVLISVGAIRNAHRIIGASRFEAVEKQEAPDAGLGREVRHRDATAPTNCRCQKKRTAIEWCCSSSNKSSPVIQSHGLQPRFIWISLRGSGKSRSTVPRRNRLPKFSSL